MRLTINDIDEVMATMRATGLKADTLPADIADLTNNLNKMVVKGAHYDELVQSLVMMVLSLSIKEGNTDIHHVVNKGSQIGLLAGVVIGFQLGMREAGLELGIGHSASKE